MTVTHHVRWTNTPFYYKGSASNPAYSHEIYGRYNWGKHVLLRVFLFPVLRDIITYNSAVFPRGFNGITKQAFDLFHSPFSLESVLSCSIHIHTLLPQSTVPLSLELYWVPVHYWPTHYDTPCKGCKAHGLNFEGLLQSYVYWTVHHLDSWIKRDQLDVTCFFISLFNAQHVSDVNTSILRS